MAYCGPLRRRRRPGRSLLGPGRRTLGWGATQSERRAALHGDHLTGAADLTATRGMTVAADPAGVWPWVAQVGQGRRGFYSYGGIENLLGMDMHSADQIISRWQDVQVGDDVRSAACLPDLVGTPRWWSRCRWRAGS